VATFGQLHVYTQVSPGEIQTVGRWNLIGHSMTTPPFVLSPNSILPPTLSHHREENFGTSSKNVAFFLFLKNYVKFEIA
jgi:hypothetical protein